MGDDIILRSTSRVEPLKLEDETVTECEIFQKTTVVMGRKERVTEEVNAYLTKDLTDEIFARLPIKTLIRFRSLSKSWYSRVTSPAFIRMFAILRSMNTSGKVLIQHATCKVTREGITEFICTLHSEDKLPLRPLRRYKDVTPVRFPSPSTLTNVIGSCNGIICLHRIKWVYTDSGSSEHGFIILNYSIRREVRIPDPPFMRGCEASLGFGFDPISNDYNIVGIFHDTRVHTSFIYSLKTNSWSEIDFPSGTVFSVMPRAILVNGALHWVATKTSNIRERMILTFNLSSHVFGTITLPEPRGKAVKLTILNGCLAVISRKMCTTRIWVMRAYDNIASWSLVHELDMEQFDSVQVIKALSNGGLLLDKSGFSEWYEVYYPETGVLSRLLKFNENSRMLDMEMYVESLELLDKGTPCGKAISRKRKEAKEKSVRES